MRLSNEELRERKTHWKDVERGSNIDRSSSALQKENAVLRRCVLP